MRNISKVAIGAIVAMSTAVANAGTYDTAASASVGTEAANAGTLSGLIQASGLVLKASPGYRIADKITLTLDNGATFEDASYVLLQSAGLDATEFTAVEYTKGDSSITFRAASTILNGSEWILSSSANAAAAVTVGLPALGAGGSIKISGSVVDPADGLTYATYKATEIFEYANEFAGAVDTKLNAQIDVAVGADRKRFTSSGTSDALALEFTETDQTYGVTLADTDTVNITLKGDLSGVASITVTTGSTLRETLTVGKGIASDYSSASVALSASDAFAAASTTLNVIAGSGILSTGEFSVSAELDFAGSQLTDPLVTEVAENAGTWTINGLQAKVANMTLNSASTISWLKVSNEGASDAIIYADIVYSLYNSTTAETKKIGVELGTVAPGTVYTVSEASIVDALGDPTGLVNATLTLTVTGPTDSVHLTAEKKASDGRLNVPVYYDGSRTWRQ